MALTGHLFPHLSTQKSSFLINPFGKASKLKQKHIPIKKTAPPSLKIRAAFNEKVFEDRLNGIICYTDESGEIVCEGMDEGPRYNEQVQRKSSYHREAEILEFQQRWINFIKGTELNCADHKGVVVQGDIKSNGFNSFR